MYRTSLVMLKQYGKYGAMTRKEHFATVYDKLV